MSTVKRMPVKVSSASSERRPAIGWFPSAYTILFALIAVMALLTWIVPAGQYDRVRNEALGKDVAVAGTYKALESNPQNIVDVILAPINGFYSISEYTANAIDVSLFVLIIGGFLGVVNRTGAITGGISAAMQALKGREQLMIPVLMALFALGGTTYGMAEETLAFYAIMTAVMIAAGYDAMTAAAIILVGAGIGVLGSTINPFATTIASNAAGIPFTTGMYLRVVILIAGWIACVAYVMRYAARVKRDPAASLVVDLRESNVAHFLGQEQPREAQQFSGRQKVVLLAFAATFAVMIWGVSLQGWWMGEMSGLFLGAALVIGIIGWIGEKSFTDAFVNGARDLLGVAIIIGIARGIVVIMDAGRITDTILHWGEVAIQGQPTGVFIVGVYLIEVAMSFLVPSTSGLAVLSMPILAPLADFAGTSRDLVVTAYQSASGIVNLITPTSAVVMGGLAIARVPYGRWLRFVWPLLVILTVIIVAALLAGTMTSVPITTSPAA
jgi:uncharacterized ion transporter superfamily protein YfcC